MSASVLIRKQKIRLRTADEQLALNMRKLLNDTLQHELTGMMERVFDNNAPSDLYINIDKLHIDLGTLQANEFEQQFTKLAETKLVNELRRQLQDYMEPVYSAEKQQHDFYDDSRSAGPFLQLNPAREQELTALVYFFEQGIYPWWYPKAAQKTPAQLLEDLSDGDTETLLLKLINLFKKNPPDTVGRIILRLFVHLPEPGYKPLICGLTNLYNQATLTRNAEVVIKHAEQLAAIFSLSQREFYRHLFSFILQDNELAVDNFLVNFFKRVVADEKLTVDELRKNQQAQKLRPELDDVIEQIIIQNETPSDPAMQARQKEEDEKITSTQDEAQPERGIYIGNAGLLLLNPFLQYLFTDAGLLTPSNQFVSERAQYKATVMLYYLQSGDTGYKEWEMALNKILCGMDYQAVLPDDILLSDQDKQICDDLLKAVVQHWEALKGAGIDALRNTFLLREGKISRKEDHWLVQVERTGADILLDRLPWGFSTIKLPWLAQLIHTEW